MITQRLARLPCNLPAFLMLAFVLPLLAGCGYNTIPQPKKTPRRRGVKFSTSISAAPI